MADQRRTQARNRRRAGEEIGGLELPVPPGKPTRSPSPRAPKARVALMPIPAALVVGIATALARQHFGKPELQVIALVAIGALMFWASGDLLRRRKQISGQQLVIFALLWLFSGALVLAVCLVARLVLPVAIHDLHAVTDKAHARWTLQGQGEPHAQVQVALELESGLLTIQTGPVSAEGRFEIDVFDGDGFWVHPDMGLALRQTFPSNPLVKDQPWIRSLALPATPAEYLAKRPDPSAAARSSSWFQTVTWNAPEARNCTRSAQGVGADIRHGAGTGLLK